MHFGEKREKAEEIAMSLVRTHVKKRRTQVEQTEIKKLFFPFSPLLNRTKTVQICFKVRRC